MLGIRTFGEYALCEYVQPYTVALEEANIFGVQFHPENSGPAGIQIVRRFIELAG